MKIAQQLETAIRQAGQEHLLRYWDELTENEQQDFHSQLEAVNFAILPEPLPPADWILNPIPRKKSSGTFKLTTAFLKAMIIADF